MYIYVVGKVHFFLHECVHRSTCLIKIILFYSIFWLRYQMKLYLKDKI